MLINFNSETIGSIDDDVLLNIKQEFGVFNHYAHSNSNDDNSSDNRTINSANKKFSTVKSKINTGLNKSESNSFNRSFRILFVDLAGSERGIDAQNNTQDNRKEGAEINQSLLAVSFIYSKFFYIF